jgi:UDP-glucose 4-epimerase
MPENILITGSGGFLGSHICEHFVRRGHPVTGIDRFSPPLAAMEVYANLRRFYEIDLPDESFIGIIRESRPNLLIHCAGSASVPYSMQEPYEDFLQSVRMTAFLLEALRKHLPSCHFIFLSSAAVYGNPGTLPVREETACRPISPYGYHKYICELLCEEYASLHSAQTSALRIFSAYGERLRKQVVFDLCRKFGDPHTHAVQLYGTGNETRDFIHAQDIAQAIEVIYTNRATGVFNVASGKQTRIGEIAGMIKTCLRSSKDVIFSGAIRPGDPLYWQADISRLLALGFHQQIPLNEGIKKYCRWYEREHGI